MPTDSIFQAGCGAQSNACGQAENKVQTLPERLTYSVMLLPRLK